MANKNFRVKHGLEVAGSATIDTDLTVTGNLTVNGTTTTLNTATLAVEDNIVVLNSNVTGTPSTNAGIEVERGTSTNSALTWNESDDKWYQDRAGVSTVIPNSTTELVQGTNLYYTDALARASISATGDINYNSTTGVISYTTPVTSVNGQTAAVSLGIADLDDATITAAGNKNFLQYNTTTSKWENGPIRDASRLAGSIEATQDTTYVFPAPTVLSVSSNNGFDIVSNNALYSAPYGAGPQTSVTNYINDTWAGANASAQHNLKGANGYSATSGVDPLTGITMTGPTAANTSMVLGSINFSGYGTTAFVSDVTAANQGGGISAFQALQIQAVPRETFADAVTTITPTAVTRFSTALTSVTITGTKGQFSCAASTLSTGQAVRFVGTWTGTGSITGYTGDNTYYIARTNGSTTFTLSAIANSGPITTTVGTTTGAAVTRNIVTFTFTAQTTAPYGSGAKITVAGITGLADGVYVTATSTTTTAIIGAVTTAVSLGATPLLSIRNTTNAGTTFRVRGFNSATNMTLVNRTNFITHDLGTATYRSDQFTFQSGSSTANLTGDKLIYNRVHGQWQYDATLTPAAADTAYAVPFQGTNATTDFANIASAVNTSQIKPNALGMYKLQFSAQVENSDNAQEHEITFWWRKNGTDISNSAGYFTVPKAAVAAGALIISWDNMVQVTTITDYYELMYAVSDTAITLPFIAAAAPRPGAASVFLTLIPVGA